MRGGITAVTFGSCKPLYQLILFSGMVVCEQLAQDCCLRVEQPKEKKNYSQKIMANIFITVSSWSILLSSCLKPAAAELA